MKITPIQNEYRIRKTKLASNKQNVSSPIHPQNNNISNVFYQPNFGSVSFETKAVKAAALKMFPKDGSIYMPDGKTIDLLKINYENLVSQTLDIVTATKEEIMAYRSHIALLEGYAKNPKDSGDFATKWVENYNPTIMTSPLGPVHYLNDSVKKATVFEPALEMLRNPQRCKSLDIPVFDEKGNYILDCVGLDIETTATEVAEAKIVQIGAAVYKKGVPVEVYNQLIDPEMLIPEEASAVNKITNAMVKDAPKMPEAAPKFLGKVLNKANGIIVTWNGINYDVLIVNRDVREMLLSDKVPKGDPLEKIIKEKHLFKVIDGQIIHQRLHQALGMSKKLGKQYHWLFCQPMEDAHNAISDVKGHMPIVEYDLRVLNDARIDKSKPLTLRQIMLFQFGEINVPNLKFEIDPIHGFNAKVSYKKSYEQEPLKFENYFNSYNLQESVVDSLAEIIGEENIAKLKAPGILGTVIDETYKGNPLNVEETTLIKGTNKKKTLAYGMLDNFRKLLGEDIADLKDYNGKSKEEIIDLIAEKSKTYVNNRANKKLSAGLWLKNVDPDDIPLGNDLPDDNITKIVAQGIKNNKKIFEELEGKSKRYLDVESSLKPEE